MLLAVDIGNTNIVCGLFYGDELVRVWRIYTDVKRTGDEYAIVVRSLFSEYGLAPSSIHLCALSSVVPTLTDTFAQMLERITSLKPLIVSPALYEKLPVRVPEAAAHEIGTDIVCNAAAAWSHYKKACIVVDFGTALTFAGIDASAAICGVAIAPGLGTAAKALNNNTAQLPIIPLDIPRTSLGMNTMEAVQSGILLGYAGLADSLITRMRADMRAQNFCGPEAPPVIATGGMCGSLDLPEGAIDLVDPDLTLRGLKIISELAVPSPAR